MKKRYFFSSFLVGLENESIDIDHIEEYQLEFRFIIDEFKEMFDDESLVYEFNFNHLFHSLTYYFIGSEWK